MDLISFTIIHDMQAIKIDEKDYHNLDRKVADYDCGMFVFKKKDVSRLIF